MREEGFTLIEILIAVTITGVIMTVVFTFFNQGLDTWERAGVDTIWEQHWRVLENDLRKNLNNLFISPLSSKVQFFSDGQKLKFIFEEDGKLKKANYFVDIYQGIFERKINELEKEEFKELSFFDEFEIERVKFYFYDTKDEYWKDYWNYEEEENLPSAIKLEVRIRNIELAPIIIPLYLGREYEG